MKVLRNPAVQFLAVGLATVSLVAVGTGLLSDRAASAEAIHDAQMTTEVLAQSVAEPALPRGLVDGDPGAIDRFDRLVHDRLLVGSVERVKIWKSDGTILYSDESRLICERYELDDGSREVLHAGGTDAEVSDLDEPENRFESSDHGLVEVYTRIESPEGEPLLFEAYFPTRVIDARRDEVASAFRWISLLGLVVLVGVATPMLWVLTRRLARGAAERHRLLESAVTASEAERRRIARDLHDGVVQDLAGTAFAVSALARSEPDAPRRDTLDRAAGSLRDGLRGLRSLMVEIHPPDLRVEGLGAALQDLIAPAANSGVRASLHVGDVEGIPEHIVALVWRVAQEAVRNALRHAKATTLDLSVGRHGHLVVLEVRDDGIGFRPGQPETEAGFGLRGLAGLVRDHGGRVEVRSLPGAGTTVRLEVQVP